MKKGKLNNNGFILVETLIVTVFVLSIFAILYNNFSPIIGEYEKREFYDDIDGKYAAYWVKRIIENSSVSFKSGVVTNYLDTMTYDGDDNITGCGGRGYLEFKCYGSADFNVDSSFSSVCENLFSRLDVEKVYVTKYKLADFNIKLSEGCDLNGNGIENSGDVFLDGVSGGIHKYVGYLPYYAVPSLNGAQYRIIVEFERKDGEGKTYMAYSTFEVIK